MTSADEYRVKAADFLALARAEFNPFQKAEYERLSLSYMRLAEQADRNGLVDLVYETPLPTSNRNRNRNSSSHRSWRTIRRAAAASSSAGPSVTKSPPRRVET
jgi:hypothetical protein